MGLTSLPTIGPSGSLGPVKSDRPGYPVTDIDTEHVAAEWNESSTRLVQVCAAVGLEDGSTPGSIEEKLQYVAAPLDGGLWPLDPPTGQLNLDGGSSVGDGTYIRINEAVSFALQVTFVALAPGLCGETVSLPVPTAFTGLVGTMVTTGGEIGYAQIVAGAVQLRFNAPNTTPRSFLLMGQYPVE